MAPATLGVHRPRHTVPGPPDRGHTTIGPLLSGTCTHNKPAHTSAAHPCDPAASSAAPCAASCGSMRRYRLPEGPAGAAAARLRRGAIEDAAVEAAAAAAEELAEAVKPAGCEGEGARGEQEDPIPPRRPLQSRRPPGRKGQGPHMSFKKAISAPSLTEAFVERWRASHAVKPHSMKDPESHGSGGHKRTCQWCYYACGRSRALSDPSASPKPKRCSTASNATAVRMCSASCWNEFHDCVPCEE